MKLTKENIKELGDYFVHALHISGLDKDPDKVNNAEYLFKACLKRYL